MKTTLTPTERVLLDLATCLGRAGATNSVARNIETMSAMDLVSTIAPNGITFTTVSEPTATGHRLPQAGDVWLHYSKEFNVRVFGASSTHVTILFKHDSKPRVYPIQTFIKRFTFYYAPSHP